MTIRTLLIANRGEIVGRVTRTARRLGITTVAVCSEADRDALHTAQADLVVAIGGDTPATSYLDIDKVLDAAARTGADAVHPGYGFLAENATFARQVIEAGLTWVGPTPDQISLMGDKVRAKDAAARAGVPLLPSTSVIDDLDTAGTSVGFPLLVKAAAGGGGRGMRLVTEPAALADAVSVCAREATAAFGDGAVYLERFVEGSRHVEVQIVGDTHGTVVHLADRDCSVQRRHQKVIEEAPATGIAATTRTAMFEAAVALARSIDYVGAGTVEFLVKGEAFHFLEMNTRLQVEHTVTEEVCGVDLVELQLDVAEGRPLRFGQADVTTNGHAIEARLYAEDPAAAFTPTYGPMHRLEPADLTAIRWEPGVASPGLVSTFYDPMLAKVVVHRNDRSRALASLVRALRTMAVHGPITNRDMLVAVLNHADFAGGDVATDFLERHPDLLDAAPGDHTARIHLVAAVASHVQTNRGDDPHWRLAPAGWRNVPSPPQSLTFQGGRELTYRIDGRRLSISIDDEEIEAEASVVGEIVQVTSGAIRTEVSVRSAAGSLWCNSALGQHVFSPQPRFVVVDSELAAGGPTAPVPGTIAAVTVAVGDRVSPGQVLVVMEAMKMEHHIEAPAEAVVVEVRVSPGDQVDAGAVLVVLEA
ncbi:MAG: biotin/lipoyl-binding protein [Acidimicrobiia bacterium]|nr:biotin/lipoyl-binding protein [Acidimicrobiia bacterium]